MMGLIDRYIARQFVFNIIAILVILFCFVITVDVSLHLDRYLRVAESSLRAGRKKDMGTSLRFCLGPT